MAEATVQKAWLAALPAHEASMKADVLSTWQNDLASAHLYQAAIKTVEPTQVISNCGTSVGF
jgi:hypothetical protein